MSEEFEGIFEEFSNTYRMIEGEFPELSQRDCFFAALKFYQNEILIEKLDKIKAGLKNIERAIVENDNSF